MEEGQGVEEHHEAMRQDVVSRLKYLWTNPDLWANIPGEQIDELVNAVSTMSAPFSRARAGGTRRSMEEGQGVEEQLQGMGQDVTVARLRHFWANPGLWVKVPGDLIDELIAAVFIITAPLSEVDFHFFSAWQKWRKFRLSMARSMKDLLPHLLYFRNLDECMILNQIDGVWEPMPLLFSSADALRLQHMELISCDGGLLYFASAERDEFIVGNPLTRHCSPTLRGLNAAQRIVSAEGKTRKSYDSSGESGLHWHLAVWNAYLSCREDIVTNTCVFVDVQLSVQRRVAKLYRYTDSFQFNDSRSGVDWVTLAEVSRGTFYYLCFPKFLSEDSKRVILGFSDDPLWPGFYAQLVYDIEKKERDWVWCRKLSPPNGRTLCASVGNGDGLIFSEFVNGGRDGGLKLASATFPPSTNVLWKGVPYEELCARTTLPKFDAIFNFVYVQQGDCEYHICLFRQDSRRGEVNISVREQNGMTGLQRISNWTKFSPSASEHLPSSKQFHIFRPSFSSPW